MPPRRFQGQTPFGTTSIVPVHPRNPLAKEQNSGISSTSLDLSELWFQELNKKYPDL